MCWPRSTFISVFYIRAASAVFPYGEQRCREIGAFRQWTKKQTDDPIFKAYRKEYKKRFAWIKAGRITDEQFYAWSEKAREEKKKCDREIISLEDFQQWLRDSKI